MADADPTLIGPAATEVAIAGKMPLLAWTFDMNGDGILDIQQPAQIAKVIAAVLSEVAPLIPGGAGIPLTLAVQLLPRVVQGLPQVLGGQP